MSGIGIGMFFGFSGVGFAPTQLSSLVAWYDPAYGITKDGSDRISAWVNKQGVSAWNLAQATGGKQPLFVSGGGQNGGHAVEFAAARVDHLASASVTANQPITVAVQFYVTNRAGGVYVADGRTEATRIVRVLAGGYPAQWAGASWYINSTSVVDGSWTAMCCVFNGAASVVRQDGTESGNGNAGTSAANGIVLGSGASGGGAMSGRVGHVLVFTSALTATERANVTTWLGRQ